MNSLNRPGIDKGVVDHEHSVHLGGRLNQGDRLFSRGRDRFGDQHVLACPQCGQGEIEVGGDGRHDNDRVDRRAGKDLVTVGGRGDRWMALLRLGQPLRPPVADDGDIEVGHLAEVSDEVRSPVTVSDDADTNGWGGDLTR